MGSLLECNLTMPHLASRGLTVQSGSGPQLPPNPRKREGGWEVIIEDQADWGQGNNPIGACSWEIFW